MKKGPPYVGMGPPAPEWLTRPDYGRQLSQRAENRWSMNEAVRCHMNWAVYSIYNQCELWWSCAVYRGAHPVGE